jgi:hypothetical protein
MNLPSTGLLTSLQGVVVSIACSPFCPVADTVHLSLSYQTPTSDICYTRSLTHPTSTRRSYNLAMKEGPSHGGFQAQHAACRVSLHCAFIWTYRAFIQIYRPLIHS